MDDAERVGQRIAASRKSLGMTQLQLAEAAHVSKSMLAKVESGHATASNAWVGAIARSLGVDPGYLLGAPHIGTVAGNAALHQLVPQVRRAIAAWDVVSIDTPQESLDRLAEQVDQLHRWRHEAQYHHIGVELPGVLSRLAVCISDHSLGELEQVRLYRMLTMTFRAANTLAHKLGYTDLSLAALDRMEWAAGQSGDPLLIAIVQYVRAGALSRLGEQGGAILLLDRAIPLVQAIPSPEGRAVLGCLHMKLVAIYGALSAEDMVTMHLTEAQHLAALSGPDRTVYETVFGPVNVQLHALSAKVDQGRPDDALAVAADVRLPADLPKERATYFWTDLARAHLLNGDADRAIEALYEARAMAPAHFANSSVVRGTLFTLASQQRRSSRGLRALANSAGIQD